jgi:hypothetical protein
MECRQGSPSPEDDMIRFRVWLRPLGGIFRIRVEGRDNAGWLLRRLSESFVFKNSQPVCDDSAASCCTFHVPDGPNLSRARLEKLLAAIPEVELMAEPA